MFKFNFRFNRIFKTYFFLYRYKEKKTYKTKKCNEPFLHDEHLIIELRFNLMFLISNNNCKKRMFQGALKLRRIFLNHSPPDNNTFKRAFLKIEKNFNQKKKS